MNRRHLLTMLVLSFLNLLLANTSHAVKTKNSAEPLLFNALAQYGVESGAMYLYSHNEPIRMQINVSFGYTVSQIGNGFAGVAGGAIRDASEAKEARALAAIAVKDVRRYLKDEQIDISAEVKQALTKELSTVEWLPSLTVVDVEGDLPSLTELQKRHHATDDLLSRATIEYFFSPNFETFNVVVNVSAYKTMRAVYREHGALLGEDKKSKKERKRLKRIYRFGIKKPYYKSHITYISERLAPMDLKTRRMTKAEKAAEKKRITAMFDEAIANAKNRKERDKYKRRKSGALGNIRKTKAFVDSANHQGKLWLENDGERLKKAIAESATDLAQLLRQDLNGTSSNDFVLDNESRFASSYVDNRKRRRILSKQR
ncbi:MAG: hypothetical protein COA42_14575 [Alteromonadaceae bacterium]|nr:MAG: hypothetical protein COA42_14575 [Alteromonadaceae bacterium]